MQLITEYESHNRINHDGNRKLILAILNKAVEDSLLYRNPRNSNKKILNHRLKLIKKRKIILKTILLVNKDNEITLSLRLMFIKILMSFQNELKKQIMRVKTESQCLKSRNWISQENEIFVKYCNFGDIDPQYFEEKAKKYFKIFDSKKIKRN